MPSAFHEIKAYQIHENYENGTAVMGSEYKVCLMGAILAYSGIIKIGSQPTISQ